MKLSEELVWRGLIKDKTFDDVSWLDEPKSFYLGADAGSADSLTVGNLAIFLVARRLLDAGWNTVLLMGGATSLIGDPGGKDSERDLVSQETVQANINGVRAQVERLFAGKPFTLVNNYDWFKNINFLSFLREVGKQYSMTELVQRDFIAERMGEGGSGISFAEFSYTLIQGYDYYHLNKEHGVVLQIGGSDQWGNMLSGVPLIRKKNGAEAHAFSMPLVINKATGKKFGKSEAGAVWLDEHKTSAYQFYQFWLNADDSGVIDYLKIYTLLSPDEIETLAKQTADQPEQRAAQKRLAYEVTVLVHGREKADGIVKVTDVLFGGRPVTELTDEDFALLSGAIPTVNRQIQGCDVLDLAVEFGLASSKREAREFLAAGSFYVNGEKLTPEQSALSEAQAIRGRVLVRRGKNKYVLVHYT